MSEEDLKIGDVVGLKSGGYRMTVTAFETLSDGRIAVVCSYFGPADSGLWGGPSGDRLHHVRLARECIMLREVVK